MYQVLLEPVAKSRFYLVLISSVGSIPRMPVQRAAETLKHNAARTEKTRRTRRKTPRQEQLRKPKR
ncbi:MAG: hypothetical protein DMG05_19335 [Acidobacteria bacterium]|nr:MAG: hypothetical protein DMG05_19335 [Acidobacteriota bacterium]